MPNGKIYYGNRHFMPESCSNNSVPPIGDVSGVASIPSPDVLHEYEIICEGSAQVIVDMANKEQKQRHHWENRSLYFSATSCMLGQLLSAVLIIVMIFVAIYLYEHNMQIFAFIIVVLGFSSVILCSFNNARLSASTKDKQCNNDIPNDSCNIGNVHGNSDTTNIKYGNKKYNHKTSYKHRRRYK